jgi:hypothetical protein
VGVARDTPKLVASEQQAKQRRKIMKEFLEEVENGSIDASEWPTGKITTGHVPPPGMRVGHEDAAPDASISEFRATFEGARVSDYPPSLTLGQAPEFTWNEDVRLVDNLVGLGRKLALSGDLYRAPRYAGGLVLASRNPLVSPSFITNARRLAAVIADRLHPRVTKGGKSKGNTISKTILDIAIQSESFLQQFDPLDEIITTPQYLGPNFQLCVPGYNNAGIGQRVLYVGPSPAIEYSLDATMRFLRVMEFASSADCTNVVAAKLIFMLRNYWLGQKPFFPIMATRSQAGKETLVSFIAGKNPKESISYQQTNWAFERAFNSTLKNNPAITLINVENVRLDNRQLFVVSAFLERFLTDAEPLLHSIGTGPDIHRKNNVIVTLTINHGLFGEDLLNRGVPILLAPQGDVASRVSPIGNPKWEFLPANHARIEAEFRGMIEKWKQAGCPRDESVKHCFGDCAQAVGGILKVNGFGDFLTNYALRTTIEDPVRQALGILGASVLLETENPRKRVRSALEWVPEVIDLGLVGKLIPPGDRENEKAYARGLGITMSRQLGVTLTHETEEARVTMRLQKARRRMKDTDSAETKSQSKTVYGFELIEITELPPVDEDALNRFRSEASDTNKSAVTAADSTPTGMGPTNDLGLAAGDTVEDVEIATGLAHEALASLNTAHDPKFFAGGRMRS